MIFSVRHVELSPSLLAGLGENVPDKERLPLCVRVCGCERVFEQYVWSSRLCLLSYLMCCVSCSLSYCLVDVCLIDSQTINKVI